MNFDVDDSTNVWPPHVDEYLTALQRGDEAEQQRLLQLDPELRNWSYPLRELDAFANLFVGPDSPQFDADIVRFGKYELRGELGRGGMGVVFQAYQADLQRSVALKMLTGSALASSEQRRRFLQEARLASRIKHPRIVTIHEVGEIGGQPYFTMDSIAGTSLSAKLKQGAFPIDQAVQMMIQIATAVDCLHTHGVLHRDLKPANILIDPQGQPCLVDFGLAKAVDGFHDPTVTGTVLGTPSYMSPEQAAGRIREVTSQSDVYSLGTILYEMLCGRPPFVADSPFDTILQVLEREPLPPRHWNRAVPKILEQICLRCLEKSPQRRYASAGDVAEDLQRWMHGERPAFASRPLVDRAIRTIRRHPAAAYRLLGLLPTLLIIFVRCGIARDYWSYYMPAIVGLSLWALLSCLWEWFAQTPPMTGWAPAAFVLSDILFLTGILQLRNAADTSHVMAYVLVILMAGLTLKRRLIWTAGLGSIAGYLYLVYHSSDWEGWHVAGVSVVLLACCTVVLDYQIRRLSIWIRPTLSQSDRGARPPINSN